MRSVPFDRSVKSCGVAFEEVGVLPRVVVRMRKFVRHLSGLDEQYARSGKKNEQNWQAMLARTYMRDFEVERRMKRAERALNRLSAG